MKVDYIHLSILEPILFFMNSELELCMFRIFFFYEIGQCTKSSVISNLQYTGFNVKPVVFLCKNLCILLF
jgi:hypothetical protein